MDIMIIASGSTKAERKKNIWGLSLVIDNDVLFDTFCSTNLLRDQFRKYKIDAGAIKHVIISHEHWDHTDGLWWVLENNKNIKVYLCNKTSETFKEKVKASGGTLVEVTSCMSIKENIFTTGEIEGTYDNKPIFEQSLVMKQDDTLAVITGCSHPGILNILTHVGLEFKNRVDLILGGLHLMNSRTDELEKTTTILDTIYRVRHLAPFHCTGEKARAYFAKYMPGQYINTTTGDFFHFNSEASTWEHEKGKNN
ncbi:MAG: MBL fold metallo-hydrolase [Spirochaetales bacterium]|nr:MBL fold metallo-hydrolase [Spirochaetales bacterium]